MASTALERATDEQFQNRSRYTLAADGEVVHFVPAGTELTYTLLKDQNAIALSDGSYWKVSPFQLHEWYGGWYFRGHYGEIMRYAETVYFDLAAESNKGRLHITYDRRFDWDPMDNSYMDGNSSGLLLMNETPKLIKLQRLIKEILMRPKRLAIAMALHPRLGDKCILSEVFDEDIIRMCLC